VTACVFLGPSLSHRAAALEFDAVYLPPAGKGDVYRAVRQGAESIGLVDGYFHQVPAVWHKEILWAMAEGVEVFGSASMGALRAAELHAFGMQGVGRIFEAYRDGLIEDDDEVAVRHGPAEVGYLAVSDAMVNIRTTLAHAVADQVIAEPTRAALERLAKATFYAERCYSKVLADARAAGSPPREIDLLAAWLPQGRVDQKRRDAIEMLRLMGARNLAGRSPRRAMYAFQATEIWERARVQFDHAPEQSVGHAILRHPGDCGDS
jgi:hypothetical protein